MTFDPTVPSTGSLISAQYNILQTNFAQSNTLYGIDHYSWNDATVANRGLHRYLTIPVPVSPAAPLGAIVNVYSKTFAEGVPPANYNELVFENPTVATQITASYLDSTAGEGFIPGGLQIRAGSGTAAVGGNPITYSQQFPTATLVVCISINTFAGAGNTFVPIASYAATGFTASSGTGNPPFRYIAIGY